MCDRIRRAVALGLSLAITVAIMVPQRGEASQTQGRSARVEHAVAGEIRKVDHAAKTVVIRTADGVDETFTFTGETAVRGAGDVMRLADVTARSVLEGGSAVVHYTGDGVDKTAVAVDHIGLRTLRTAKGTVTRVDEAGKFVVIKTAAGIEETYQLTRDVVIDTLRGLEEAARATSHTIKKGAEVTVHYADEGGKKVAYLLRHA